VEDDGQTRVWLLAPDAVPRGGSSIPNISMCPRDGGVSSSLVDVLETSGSLAKYFLSPKACAGILRRAEKRGKELPPMLKTALKSACQNEK